MAALKQTDSKQLAIPGGMQPGPVILHLDMDAFYAAIEQVDHPELRGRPVIIGGRRRGVVTAASYEARRYGIFAAMPVAQALRLCPEAVLLPVRLDRYREVSQQIMALLHTVSPLVEQVSIDEAYVDLNGTSRSQGPPEAVARRLKGEIRAATGLTCSIGLAPNKLLAKIASDFEKPDGLTIVPPESVAEFLHPLPLSRLPGLGVKALTVLQSLGVAKIGDILRHPPSFWRQHLGKSGLSLYTKALGRDDRPVQPAKAPKSLGVEVTLPQDTADLELLQEHLLRQAERLGEELRSAGMGAQTITLKLKYANFREISRSHTLGWPTHSTRIIFHTTLKLLQELQLKQKIRLVGIGVTGLAPQDRQGVLLPDPDLERQGQLDETLDRIRKRFGPQAIYRGGIKKLPPS